MVTASILNGFEMCPFIPESKDACTSSLKAFADCAMIGIFAASGRSLLIARIALAAWCPFILGIRTSIRITSYVSAGLLAKQATTIRVARKNILPKSKIFLELFWFFALFLYRGTKKPSFPLFCTLATEYPNHRLHTTDLAATQGAFRQVRPVLTRWGCLTAAERLQRRERWRGTHTSSEGSAIMIHTVAMLSRRRRYCQQCGTGSGSCFQQPGRWFALISGK